jgi:malate dehydrogenase (oxaloacetate-decarboxylating)
LSGLAVLRNPYFNKGTAFTREEREEFDLHGLLPPNVQSLEEQLARAYAQYSSRSDPLAKNTFMTSMREQNAVLFYRVVHTCGSQ